MKKRGKKKDGKKVGVAREWVGKKQKEKERGREGCKLPIVKIFRLENCRSFERKSFSCFLKSISKDTKTDERLRHLRQEVATVFTHLSFSLTFLIILEDSSEDEFNDRFTYYHFCLVLLAT